MTVAAAASASAIERLVQRLRGAIAGRIITASDADYESARQVVYGGIDRHPAAIVRVAKDGDVARVIDEVRESRVPFGVRSGGHSIAGHSTSEGGIVLDVRDMQRLEIDPRSRTAWAETGLTAVELNKRTAADGLA